MKVALIGYRGMVGSVLVNRMIEEGDFKKHNVQFFSTSMAGSEVKNADYLCSNILGDAYNVDYLKSFDAVLTCQGSDYTKKVYPRLKNEKWNGYWIDAASHLRMVKESLICLDPVNFEHLISGLKNGVKTFVGGNCTVSLLLMAMSPLFKNNYIDWISSMTYQAASGAGAKNMKELLGQMKFLGNYADEFIQMNKNILEIDQKTNEGIAHPNFPKSEFGYPLAGNTLPWIDVLVEDGQSKEEWKAMVEANKILQTPSDIPIDGTCVRVGSMRSHAQGLTIKLNKDIPVDEVSQMISEDNDWAYAVSNNKDETLRELTPAKISGTMNIPVGRLRKMKMGSDYLNAFTVGDQLLWGAAEPLRRMLNIINEF
jgi:aspartate-semialdehyde dehydrogenase